MTQDAELRELMDAVKGRDSVSGAARMEETARGLFPVAERLRKKEEDRLRAEAEAYDLISASGDPSALIGREFKGHGIFIGQCTLKDWTQGSKLSRTFNVFAAPQDLTDSTGRIAEMKYMEAVGRLGRLKGWHGHDGSGYLSDVELNTALFDCSYKGTWIIPTSDMLFGQDVFGNETTPDNLLKHYNADALKNTFNHTVFFDGKEADHGLYWSCSTKPFRGLRELFVASIPGCFNDWAVKDMRLYCRPVRLVPAAQGGL